jgi:hypothetical protein
MKDIIKIIVLLLVLIAMIGGFWYLFKDNKVFDHKKDTSENKEVLSEEKTNDEEEKEQSSTEVTSEEVKKEEQKKIESKKETNSKVENKSENIESKKDTTTETKEDTNKKDTTTETKEDTNKKDVNSSPIKLYAKPRCVFTGEEDKYSYIMTYVGYFDHDNEYLMDKININFQYNVKNGVNIEDVRKEAQEDIKDHPGFSGGFRVIDGHVVVNLEGDTKAFSKVYLDGIVDNIDMNTFKSILKAEGATCY